MQKGRIFTVICLFSVIALLICSCASSGDVQSESVVLDGSMTTTVTDENSNACPVSTVIDNKGLVSEFPQQFELEELDCEMVFTDNPLFADQVADGNLPVVEERLPKDVLVVQPYEEIGKYGGTLRGAAVAPESGTAEILSWRHVNLVRYADDGQTIVPNVAKNWEWNDDYTAITFYLREGMKWSDGVPFTADDILFWWDDIKLNTDLTPTIPGFFVFGGEAMMVEKVDDYAVTFSFASPTPGFLTFMAVRYVQPFQPKHFLSQFHIDYNAEANDDAIAEGYEDWTGLFRSYYHDWKDSYHRIGVPTLESHILVEETTEYRRFVANPYYFKVDTKGQQLPYIDEHYEVFISDKEVTNLKIISGEIDLKLQNLDLTSYPVFKENEEAGYYTVQLPPAGLSTGMVYYFNITSKDLVLREIFSNQNFKNAMSLAIDREEISEKAYLGLGEPMQGLPADPINCAFVTEEMATYMTEYNPEQASQLLDEMGLTVASDGWRVRPDGQTLIVYIEYPQQAGPVIVTELIKEYWEAVGVKTEIKEVSTEAFRARTLTNDQDVALWMNAGTALPSLVANQVRLYPPFAIGLHSFTGIPWMDWWNSNGTEGEEPPDEMKALREMAIEFGNLEAGTEEWMELGAEIVEIHLENMFAIGTVGNVPTPLIVSNRLGNVPEWGFAHSDYYFMYPFRVDQFYITE